MHRLFSVSLTALVLAAAGPVADASAQCCGQPTVAYSPVVAAPAPVVQTTTVSNRWYPGKYLTDFTRSVFGGNRTTTTYTANYAPTAYTAGYAPTYSVGYAPSPYVAGYAPAYNRVAYRPTYPVTYGPVTQTVSRPVVLSPVVSAPACNTCSTGCTGCSACGGVEQAYYGAPSTGCSSCASGSTYIQAAPSGGLEPRPALPADANVPGERSIEVQRPETEDAFNEFDDPIQSDPAAANDYWRAPPLFSPPANQRVTRNTHPAPVQTAVYRRPADARTTSYRPANDEAPARGRVHRLGADGWVSAE